MKLYGFCISDPKPVNSTRYYAHIDKFEVQVMHYTKDGYEKFCKIFFDENKPEHDEEMKKIIIQQHVGQFHREEYRKNLAE